MEHLLRRKEKLYRWMYEFTQTQCRVCATSGCACKDSICAHVEEQAARLGHRFAHGSHRLRFIRDKGCVVPPHLRETCTLYLCDSAQREADFDRKTYERLKGVIARLEWRLLELAARPAPPVPRPLQPSNDISRKTASQIS